jgi:hypothetical protein
MEITGNVTKVLLVHGTWPNGILPRLRRSTRWFEDGSDFRVRLTNDLAIQNISAEISSFQWSGRNSIFAREQAAVELAALIENQQLDGPPLVIIAHSHSFTLDPLL